MNSTITKTTITTTTNKNTNKNNTPMIIFMCRSTCAYIYLPR